jgi:hypothetical protein
LTEAEEGHCLCFTARCLFVSVFVCLWMIKSFCVFLFFCGGFRNPGGKGSNFRSKKGNRGQKKVLSVKKRYCRGVRKRYFRSKKGTLCLEEHKESDI